MKYTNRADLLIAAGKSIKMQENAGIVPVCKVEQLCKVKPLIYDISEVSFCVDPQDYEFPLAVVEGKAVFVGDELWSKFFQEKFIVSGADDDCFTVINKPTARIIVANCSWNKPKPKTVMVELLREDAQRMAHYYDARISNACRRALEELNDALQD